MIITPSALLKSDFHKIDSFYEKLNSDTSHFQTSNDICTPLGCVKEMVDTIPDSFWRRKKIDVLDSCCGNGNFHAYIQKKTSMDNLHFNEINEDRIKNVKRIFGCKINITTKDFLSFPDEEAFDLVVSNPPYAKFNAGKRVSKNHNLSRDFILKAINVTKPNGFILFITPDNWMSYSDRNVLPRLMSNYQFVHLNIHGAKKWFPKVGSSFTWFLLKKTANTKKFTVENHYLKSDVRSARIEKGIDFIPLYFSSEISRIFKKTVWANAEKYHVETSSDLHRFTKKDLISDHAHRSFPYKLIHTPRQTVWSKRPHKHQKGWKVFISLTDRYQTFIDNCGMTQSVAYIRCKSMNEAKRIKNELDKPLYRFLNNLTRYGNFNNVRVLQNLPVWEEIGAKLTAEEHQIIKRFARRIIMAKRASNKSEDPIKKKSELGTEILWDEYEHKDKFTYVCEVIADREKEKLEITEQKKEDMKKSCVYIMVVDGRIFKIGTALRGMQGRIGSYNAGKTKYRVRATNSGANFWVLHSFINMGCPVKIYAYYPAIKKGKAFGETINDAFPSAKAVEGIVIRLFKERYGRMPIGNMQK